MANRWCDGFGRYGGDTAKMLNGSSSQAWAQITDRVELSTDKPRTGTHSLKFTTVGATEEIARRVFGAPLDEAFVGFAIHCVALPNIEPQVGSLTGGVILPTFSDQSNQNQLSFVLGTDGAIAVYRAGKYLVDGKWSGTLIGRTVPIIGAGAYQHVEIYARASETDGAVEIRVDEITRLSLSGINTAPTGSVEFSQVKWWKYLLALPGAIYIADAYCNDTVVDGSGCHTFIGDCKSGCRMVDADTAQADFTLSAGSDGFALLDDTPPDDATYISTSATTAESNFGLADGPANLSEILTVRPFVRAQKDDAGSALIAPSVKSNSIKAAVDGQPITTAFAYYDDNVPLNPDTDAPWTLSEFNAALHVVERTT